MQQLFFSVRLCFLVFVLILSGGTAFAQNNTISGIVFDQTGRQPVSQVYVEVLNELYITLKRVRTDGSGRYYFSGLSSGSFKIKVLPFGTNFEEQVQDATVANFGADGGRTSSDNVYLDFQLKLDPRKANTNSNSEIGVVYAQEVPANARKLYNKAVQEISQGKDSGLVILEQAIEAFPSYYDALNRIGTEYVQRKEYKKSVSYLVRAIDINQRSFSSFYALGVASYNLNHTKEAIEAMRAATILNTQSVNAKIWYGRLLRIDEKYELSEKIFRQAKDLTKNSPVSDISWELALLFNKTKRYKQAADELEIFLKLQPDSRDAEQIKKLIAQLRIQR